MNLIICLFGIFTSHVMARESDESASEIYPFKLGLNGFLLHLSKKHCIFTIIRIL
ncbi:hypothetical protein FD47_GL000976 [Lentilactobacillus parafarraginis DSM 18390 = JCM 14109]|uniref:Uncharacterized protein n=1 Tax=Lentilactobacillus parafarraginis DSM 18390 = JCM 14109 TaxID=1423786 RepID=A0A0R1YWK9_9LACO|nr:hypothetical protein FD47_GL000976 [Lentilactobacillus parafarraginis DSM 18390 = JCM 14109]